MLHTHFLWKKGLMIQGKGVDETILINPFFDHDGTRNHLEKHPNAPVVGTDDENGNSRYKKLIEGKNTIGVFSLDYISEGENSFLLIEYNTSKIFYDISTQSSDILETLTSKGKFELYIPDLSISEADVHLEILHKLGGSKYVVPFPSIEQDSAISFARSVMMQHLGIPKFLKPGQHLAHI